jgi:hypothetical protein
MRHCGSDSLEGVFISDAQESPNHLDQITNWRLNMETGQLLENFAFHAAKPALNNTPSV